MTRDFPTLSEVIAMHSSLIDEFGGARGIRDERVLESALMRPQIGYYQSLNQVAAALMESLANNHPFVDGNKRVSFFVTDTFLHMNGFFINCEGEDAYAFSMELFDTGSFRFSELESWLGAHTQPPPRVP